MINDEMLGGDFYPYDTYFHNCTGSNDYDNLMDTNSPINNDYADWCNVESNREAIHVGNATF